MLRKMVHPMQPVTEKVSLILLCWLARVPVSASTQTCAIVFLGSAPLVKPGMVWPGNGRPAPRRFWHSGMPDPNGAAANRKLVSLSPYERRPNPHIGLPGHNGAGQNRKQDLPLQSQGGQIHTAA